MKRFYNYKTTLLFISLAMSLSILFGFSMARNVSIETPIRIVDFTSMTQDQLLTWSQENDIKFVTEEVYDDTVEIGKVLSQNVIVGERLFAGSTVKVTLSKGPDPEVMVNLIDFKGKDIGEIQQFIENNRLLAATIEFEKSSDVSSAYFIRLDTTLTSVKRGQSLKFFISTGSKDELTTVLVPDFTEYTRTQIASWGTTNNIKTNFVDEFNNDIVSGKVISQSQAANSQIYDGSSITVKLSLGAGVVLENMVGKSKSTIDKFINDNGLKVSYSYTYSSTQNKDLGVSMTPSASTKVGNGSTVNITLSLGKISVTDFKGKTLTQLQAWITEVNKQGANLKVTSTQGYSDDVNSGLISTQTPSSGDINPGSSIVVVVSRGKGVVVNNFVGTTTITQEGLKITTSKLYHASIPSGQVISQLPTANTRVDSNSTVNLVVSLGKVQVGSYSTLGLLQDWKNSVNANGGNISVITSEIWNAATKGSLVSHSPINSAVNPGTTINAVISRGPSVRVPTYSGCTDAANLIENCVYVENSTPAGTVLSQIPAANEEVAVGTTVTIRISKGPPVVEIKTVPPAASFLSGREINSVADAQNFIRAGMASAGFNTVSFTTTTVACAYIGEVKGQSPSPLTDHPVNTGISVTLCSAGN